MATHFKNDTIDCIFLDGDHSYNGLVTDFRAWLLILKNGKCRLFLFSLCFFHEVYSLINVLGGTIIFDDYSSSYPGLVLAVDQFVDNVRDYYYYYYFYFYFYFYFIILMLSILPSALRPCLYNYH
jgi:hypothetical protein